jgi:hypothetical protein
MKEFELYGQTGMELIFSNLNRNARFVDDAMTTTQLKMGTTARY